MVINKFFNDVAHQSIDTISVDIFDTIVFRKVAKPTDIFKLAFNTCAIQGETGWSAQDFVSYRINAERKSRSLVGHREVSLCDIYDQLPINKSFQTQLMNCELAVESEQTFVFEELVELLKSMQGSGKQIVLISDMYLSADQIKQYCFQLDPFLCSLPIFVSSEVKATKRNGLLFEHVRKQLNITYKRWLHVGDHAISDYKVPISLGMNAILTQQGLDFQTITQIEEKGFQFSCSFNSARCIAASCQKDFNLSYQLGAYVWGPILFGFVDWIIEKSFSLQAKHILCIMREGELLKELLESRIRSLGEDGVKVNLLFASRKSVFWAGVETESEKWFEQLLQTMTQVMGYTVRAFCRDFQITSKSFYNFYELNLKHTDSIKYESSTLYQNLILKAYENKHKIAQFIDSQNRAFKRHFNSLNCELSDSIVVDLGYGGTTQHYLEQLLNCQAKANLLFYANRRIYRFINQTQYCSYIDSHNAAWAINEIFARSPECIEALLVGYTGTTLNYESSGCPMLGETIKENQSAVEEFTQGVIAFFSNFVKYFNGKHIEQSQVTAILARYIQAPTYEESSIIKDLLHEDNFGANNLYPVIDQTQIEILQAEGLEAAYIKYKQNLNWQKRILTWIPGIIALSDPGFFKRYYCSASSEETSELVALINKVKQAKWSQFSVYGAGEIFEKFLPYLDSNPFYIEAVVDRKATLNGSYFEKGYPVISIETALKEGKRQFVILSFAFSHDIIKTINETAKTLAITDKLELIYL
ncbi:hypothetical protein N7931_03775 [Catenovulum sp. 2E275]|uniref:hypothetical protein n=1 Tax=Catenovulum sp. 2E275 TaxID=2980497 RepID=UPI0021D003B2|nr:hypothetical protein [Catenovulum sp. 2E275]MCU4674746.1 hypothetical protein [Catenovulum sp. 2E275]